MQCHYHEVPHVVTYTDFIVVVLVLVRRPRLNSDFEDEHEYDDEVEKYQIRSLA